MCPSPKVAFTGSTPIGQELRRRVAGSGKKISLELGGKNPVIIFDTADLDSAVEGIVDGSFFNQGQVCCSGSRILVQENTVDKFLKKLKRRLASWKLGHSLEKVCVSFRLCVRCLAGWFLATNGFFISFFADLCYHNSNSRQANLDTHFIQIHSPTLASVLRNPLPRIESLLSFPPSLDSLCLPGPPSLSSPLACLALPYLLACPAHGWRGL